MRLRTPLFFFFGLIALVTVAAAGQAADPPAASGTLIDGYRVIRLEPADGPLRVTVYRGDYVKFIAPAALADRRLTIEALAIAADLGSDPLAAAVVKARQAGRYPLTFAGRSGELAVVDFRRAGYSELSAEQAAVFIARDRPLILDVRTRAEYDQARLDGAVLIPVQELQRRLSELAPHKQDDILIYCATGNRSTVAAKILLDQGFSRIYNLRHGIVDWYQRRLPVKP